MELSIIIVNYNTLSITSDCIDSIIKSNAKVKYEILLVDNGSNDGSKSFFSEFAEKNYNFKYFYNKSNLGFSKANNIGIKNSTGRYVLLLNSDTLVKKGSIDKLVDFVVGRKNVGVVGARLLNKDGSIQNSCFNFPTIKRAIEQYWFGKHKELDKYAPITDKPVTVDAVAGAAFLITPEARRSVGLLDEKYFFYYEDIDYCRRVAKANLKTFYHPGSEVVHLHGASGVKISKDETQWKRLIPSSKIYHGILRHYIFNFVLLSGQKIMGVKS